MPKLELAVILTYFIVFASVRRPSTTPSATTARSLSKQHQIRGLLGHIGSGVGRDAGIGNPKRGNIVDPITEKPDRVSIVAQRGHDAGLVAGRQLGEHTCPRRHRIADCDRSAGRSRLPRTTICGSTSTWHATWRATILLSPVRIFTATP